MEQVFFNIPLSKLEPIFKQWMKDVENEFREAQPSNSYQHEILLTVPEAADLLKLTVQTIYVKVSNGELPVRKKGKRLYFLREELLDYIKSGNRIPREQIDRLASEYISKTKG